ncbi:MAG: murein hydrolase activator EnvC family protein [Saccharofermentanales bacterium]|jgi:murein DD-endopeptidase MepM/ murein hydrolase activator NlpD/cell division protein FtsB
MSRKTTVKRWSMRLLASFLVVLTVSIGFALLTGRVEAASSKVTQAQKKLKGIQDQLAATKSDRNKLANRQKKLTGELAYLENRSKEQRKVYDEALEQKELALETMVMYQQSYACALQDLDDKVAQYEQRIARMYEWNQKSVFEMLITSDDLASFFTTMRLMKIVADADEQALSDLEAASALAEELKQEAEESYEEMTQLVNEADAVLAEIKKEQALAKKQLSKLSNSLELTKQKQAQLERDKTSAERNLKAIKIEEEAKKKRASTKTTNIPSSRNALYVGTGKYIWPTPGSFWVTSHFGWRAKYGRFHYGTDIGCATGTRIVAMADGVVTYVGWPGSNYNWAYGKMIVINHYDGTQTRYGHLSAFNCHMGQKVKAGQVIGYTGNTGRSSGPHLHFEIRVNGKHVNPMNYFKRTR